jgi:hypothetical protein
MVEPQTWRMIKDWSTTLWTVVGPVAGIFIGAWLVRSWDEKKWERDNVKDECRELLQTITHAGTLTLAAVEGGSGVSRSVAHEAYLQSLKTLHDRIFIAEQIEKLGLVDLWAHAVGDYGSQKIKSAEFSDRLDQALKLIRGLVTNK